MKAMKYNLFYSSPTVRNVLQCQDASGLPRRNIMRLWNPEVATFAEIRELRAPNQVAPTIEVAPVKEAPLAADVHGVAPQFSPGLCVAGQSIRGVVTTTWAMLGNIYCNVKLSQEVSSQSAFRNYGPI